jgi:hypothetical protein
MGLDARAVEWRAPAFGRKQDLKQVLGIVASTPSGQRLLEKVRIRDPDYLSRLKLGNGSLTESTLRRSFDLANGREWFELYQEVTLHKGLSLADAVLDLTHELTHFALRQPMNPYQLDFDEVAFIRHGIEGTGGELDAFLSECQVAKEMRQKDASFPGHPLCGAYQSALTTNREQARRDFYRVGQDDFSFRLRAVIPELKSQRVIFRSAQAGTAYPVALAKEFAETIRTACQNNMRRLELIQVRVSAMQKEGNRAPASAPENLKSAAARISAYQSRYCRSR